MIVDSIASRAGVAAEYAISLRNKIPKVHKPLGPAQPKRVLGDRYLASIYGCSPKMCQKQRPTQSRIVCEWQGSDNCKDFTALVEWAGN